MKTRSLVLYHPAYRHQDKKGAHLDSPIIGYGVASVKNTIDFVPGQFLSKDQVNDLVNLSNYEISVRPFADKDPQINWSL